MFSECEDKTFGHDCHFHCHCLYDVICNLKTGNCPSGCAKNWLDDACQTGMGSNSNFDMIMHVN